MWSGRPVAALEGGTLHGHLAGLQPGPARSVATKSALLLTSHLIEDLVAASAGPDVLVACFQRSHHWQREHARYASLAGRTTVVAVHAPEDPPAAVGEGGASTHVVEVGVRQDHPFITEWFVLALGPRISVTLCGLDLASDAVEEDDRTFDTILSVDRALTATAVAFVLGQLGDQMPEGVLTRQPDARAATDADRQTGVLLSGMLAQFGQLRRAEQAAHRASARLHEQAHAAGERERHRLAQALHDQSLQVLLAARQDLDEVELPGADEALAAAKANLTLGLHSLRHTVGAMHLDFASDDLPQRLRALGNSVGARGGFVTQVAVAPEAAGRADERVMTIVRELLVNTAKHAQARHAGVSVSLAPETRSLVVEVHDDGIGADAAQMAAARASGHIGLALTRERVHATGGRWSQETAPGEGFRVEVLLPLPPGG